MQNRYFGDVGDYGKYGLLRKLCGVTAGGPALSLGVVWYLVPDEGHNDDGKHISYLQKVEYRSCDPSLFDGLNKLLDDGIRTVSKIEKSNLLPRRTIFFNKFLSFNGMPISGDENRSARLSARKKWLLEAHKTVRDCDIVFLDPDNGFQIKSIPQHADKGPKYVFWDEANHFLGDANTLVIYHHLNRTKTSREQINIKVQEFKTNLSGGNTVFPVLFKRGSHRVFFVVPSIKDRTLIETRLRELQTSLWAPHMEVFSL
ncbi:MAG TPA: hypothetical protein ENI69_07020 [Rhodospirillales bacterium]|nr:hypothetical protein [Rhodospirillales bacterium]